MQQVNGAEACAVACDILLACQGFFLWVVSSNAQRCITLRSTGAVSGAPTSLRGYSYARLDTFTTSTSAFAFTSPATTTTPNAATPLPSSDPFDLLAAENRAETVNTLASGAYLFDGRYVLEMDKAPALSAAGFSLVVSFARATSSSGMSCCLGQAYSRGGGGRFGLRQLTVLLAFLASAHPLCSSPGCNVASFHPRASPLVSPRLSREQKQR